MDAGSDGRWSRPISAVAGSSARFALATPPQNHYKHSAAYDRANEPFPHRASGSQGVAQVEVVADVTTVTTCATTRTTDRIAATGAARRTATGSTRRTTPSTVTIVPREAAVSVPVEPSTGPGGATRPACREAERTGWQHALRREDGVEAAASSGMLQAGFSHCADSAAQHVVPVQTTRLAAPRDLRQTDQGAGGSGETDRQRSLEWIRGGGNFGQTQITR